jgi:sugar fermentation stimulation protein A
MKLPAPILEGRFVKRYKRFFADLELEGQLVTAHVPNTGSLISCLEVGASCWVSSNNDPKRKLKYTLQMVEAHGSKVGVNTGLANALVAEAFQNRAIPHWQKFDCLQAEVKLSAETRLDFALWKSSAERPVSDKITLQNLNSSSLHFVEVKNVTLAEGSIAMFPDAVTTRGQKHLDELVGLVDAGHTAEIFFVVQREGCTSFSPARDIDPVYAEKLERAQNAGVIVSAWACDFTPHEIRIEKYTPISWPSHPSGKE